MILNGLVLISLPLTLLHAMSVSDIGTTLLKFGNNIRGMDLYESEFLGVALDKEVYIGHLQNNNLEKIGRIPLNEHVYADASGDPLLEFKLINESSALTCTSGGCSVCSMSALTPNCYGIPLSPNRGKLTSVSATFVNNDVVLRTVHDKNHASIHYLFLTHEFKLYVFGRRSIDAPSLDEIETVAGFSTPTHSYFVGSAKRLDLPLFSLNNNYKRNNGDIRITQICNKDETVNLASRIDLVLSCEGINYDHISKEVSNRATAALYLQATSTLLVAFQHYVPDYGITENYICGYDFTELQWRFTKTWDKCQSMPKPELTNTKCREQFKNYANLTEDCFLFSRDNHMNEPYCSAYNGATGDTQFDNCELHKSTSTSNAYGSLENFKAYNGMLLFKEKHTQPIVAIREMPNESALYALRKDDHLIRIGGIRTKNVLISVLGKSGKHLLELLPSSKKVLFVPTHSENTVNAFTSSCEGIYKKCQSIAWEDPLHCFYCANQDGSGTAVPLKMACPDNVLYDLVCPPTILEATANDNGTYFITGTDLDKFLEDPEVTVCDSQCNLTAAVTPTIIRCSTGTPRFGTCEVKIKGSLDSTYKDVTFSKQLQHSNITPVRYSTKNSSLPVTNFRLVIAIIMLVGLLVSICIIYICISRHCATKLKKKYGSEYGRIPSDRHRNPLTVQLNPNDLIVLNTQPLGEGVSAAVYKGSFKISAIENVPVAVKIFHTECVHMVNTTELIDELIVLRRVEHANIVGFIGHTYIDRTLHIVTEFMAGGSLYDYIRSQNTDLKYQHTFDYMAQILSAMVYLTQQEIVHRDLAARNCLLNGDCTILKVSDFGLARIVDFNGEYKIMHREIALPTRWIAIEAFSQLKFTEKTDVWSFGVLVWELFTRGNTPYFPLDHFPIQEFLKEGRRLEHPEACPDQIYAVIITCWDSDPERRPTFVQLQKEIMHVVRYLVRSNKQLIESGYERPSSQPLTYVGSRAVAEFSV